MHIKNEKKRRKERIIFVREVFRRSKRREVALSCILQSVVLNRNGRFCGRKREKGVACGEPHYGDRGFIRSWEIDVCAEIRANLKDPCLSFGCFLLKTGLGGVFPGGVRRSSARNCEPMPMDCGRELQSYVWDPGRTCGYNNLFGTAPISVPVACDQALFGEHGESAAYGRRVSGKME